MAVNCAVYIIHIEQLGRVSVLIQRRDDIIAEMGSRKHKEAVFLNAGNGFSFSVCVKGGNAVAVILTAGKIARRYFYCNAVYIRLYNNSVLSE